ncbi:MAG: molecular chaperone DnaK [Alteromonadales bacterium]|nr:molecular chaperone DnaK [Alteromonadales bacterium]
MPPFNETQLAQFKVQLDAEQAQIRSTIETIFLNSDHASHHLAAKNLSRLSNDELIEFVLKINCTSLSKSIDKLKKLDASLVSIELGMFGFCSDCESELSETLLHKDATIQRCPDCEAKYQKQRYNNYRL